MSKWNIEIRTVNEFDLVMAICCYRKEQHTILSSYLHVESAVYKEDNCIFLKKYPKKLKSYAAILRVLTIVLD